MSIDGTYQVPATVYSPEEEFNSSLTIPELTEPAQFWMNAVGAAKDSFCTDKGFFKGDDYVRII